MLNTKNLSKIMPITINEIIEELKKRGYETPNFEPKKKLKKPNKTNITKFNKIHNIKLIQINNFINGDMIGLTPDSKFNRFLKNKGYIPDIIKDNCEYEFENIGECMYNKFTNKWKTNRFDNETPKKRILILDIPKHLKKIFDEIYFYDGDNLKNINYFVVT